MHSLQQCFGGLQLPYKQLVHVLAMAEWWDTTTLLHRISGLNSLQPMQGKVLAYLCIIPSMVLKIFELHRIS
jgi:hypothetical protein